MNHRPNIVLRIAIAVLVGALATGLSSCASRSNSSGSTEAVTSAAATGEDTPAEAAAPPPAEPVAPPAVEPANEPAGPVDPASLATCDAVREAYVRLVAVRSCSVDADCQLVGGSCSEGLGGCHEAVNVSVTQEQLGELTNRWTALGCIAGACRCARPGQPKCEAGVCVEVEAP